MPFPLDRHALKSVRLIATDMDGTLTRQGKFTVPLLNSLVELASAGIQVVIITGRSAGWVQAIGHYLPIAGAIAENGGLFYRGATHAAAGEAPGELLVPIADLTQHRQILAEMFQQLQQEFPQIQASADNPFRLTDWTFPVQGLSLEELQQMGDRCQQAGWDITYSTVQCHLKLPQQEKAIGLTTVLSRYFPGYAPEQVVTVGDSPNDESLFDRDQFPLSVGVANVEHYLDRLTHQPTFITQAPEAEGFCELAQCLLKNQTT